MLPVLALLYVAGFGYFDAYRREAVLTKATYTMGDLLSREEGTITPVDLEGMQGIFEFLTFSEGETWLRTTEVQRNANTINVVWSYATDGNPILTNDSIKGYLNQIPSLGDGERVVMSESFTGFDPVFDIGLSDRTYTRLITTRQRYASRLDFDGTVVPTSVATVNSTGSTGGSVCDNPPNGYAYGWWANGPGKNCTNNPYK